jgi:microsomal dipeptidase-like Zn-dependent dipeptidase
MIRAMLELAGKGGVAIGSDMDGALRELIDVEGLPGLTSALLHDGMAPATVAGVIGANAVELLRRALPSG